MGYPYHNFCLGFFWGAPNYRPKTLHPENPRSGTNNEVSQPAGAFSKMRRVKGVAEILSAGHQLLAKKQGSFFHHAPTPSCNSSTLIYVLSSPYQTSLLPSGTKSRSSKSCRDTKRDASGQGIGASTSKAPQTPRHYYIIYI